MKTIVVATDFSAASMNAALYAAEMASIINAEILLLHVFQVPGSIAEVPGATNFEKLLHTAELEINDLKKILSWQTSGNLKITPVVKIGGFYSELKMVCEEVKPYTVVMGSQGTTATERLFFGGHSVYAMKHLLWPIITVPPEARYSKIKKIGFACDFGKKDETIPIVEIMQLAQDFKSEIHILNTGRREVFNPELVFQSGILYEQLMELHPNFHFITNNNTDEGILDFAEKNQIGLLVVFPKRHGLLEGMMHKSHTKQLVLLSNVPVRALHIS